MFQKWKAQESHDRERTHGPLSGAEVLQGAGSRLQSVVVLALCQQGEVEPHHFRLVEQLKACTETHTQTRTQTQLARTASVFCIEATLIFQFFYPLKAGTAATLILHNDFISQLILQSFRATSTGGSCWVLSSSTQSSDRLATKTDGETMAVSPGRHAQSPAFNTLWLYKWGKSHRGWKKLLIGQLGSSQAGGFLSQEPITTVWPDSQSSLMETSLHYQLLDRAPHKHGIHILKKIYVVFF